MQQNNEKNSVKPVDLSTKDAFRQICIHLFYVFQGCALRKITRSPKVPNYEIQGAQHKAYMKEITLSGRPKAKVSCLRHPGALRAQPFF